MYLLLLGVLCACPDMSPKVNFMEMMNARIGDTIDPSQSHQFGYIKDLVKSELLPNGNLENKYFWKHPLGTCIYVFEIDAKTNHILSWRIEGNPDGCIVNP